jgi:hypothetical protein
MYIHDLNREYELQYYDDEMSRQFLTNYFPPEVINCYDKLIPGAYKADLFRAAYLYQNGGIYIDTGMLPLIPFRDIINEQTTFLCVKDYTKIGKRHDNYIYNALLACTAKHPIMYEYLQNIISNVSQENYGEDPLDITGPAVLGKICQRSMPPDAIILQLELSGKFLTAGTFCITYNRHNICYTKYKGYRQDQKNNNKPHYCDYYNNRNVFGQDILSTKNVTEDKSTNQEFFHDFYEPGISIKNKCYNLQGEQITMYYSSASSQFERNNLLYLQRMNPECIFQESKEHSDVDLKKFYLYPLINGMLY